MVTDLDSRCGPDGLHVNPWATPESTTSTGHANECFGVVANRIESVYGPGHLAVVTAGGRLAVLNENREPVREWPPGSWTLTAGRACIAHPSDCATPSERRPKRPRRI